MSVRVELGDLRDAIARAGATTYLLTVTDDGRPHAVSVAPGWDGDDLVVDVGASTAANAAARPSVTLLWAPAERGDYSLIVDGDARVEERRVRVTPAKSVWHRSAEAPDGGVRSDCVTVYRA